MGAVVVFDNKVPQLHVAPSQSLDYIYIYYFILYDFKYCLDYSYNNLFHDLWVIQQQ